RACRTQLCLANQCVGEQEEEEEFQACWSALVDLRLHAVWLPQGPDGTAQTQRRQTEQCAATYAPYDRCDISSWHVPPPAVVAWWRTFDDNGTQSQSPPQRGHHGGKPTPLYRQLLKPSTNAADVLSFRCARTGGELIAFQRVPAHPSSRLHTLSQAA